MSLDTDRNAIAAALSTVPGVRGYAYRPPAPREGDAYPTLPTLDLDRGLVWRPTWTVNVILPADERSASTWIDANFLAIVAALRSGNGFPESAEPALMQTPDGPLYVLEITLRSH